MIVRKTNNQQGGHGKITYLWEDGTFPDFVRELLKDRDNYTHIASAKDVQVLEGDIDFDKPGWYDCRNGELVIAYDDQTIRRYNDDNIIYEYAFSIEQRSRIDHVMSDPDDEDGYYQDDALKVSGGLTEDHFVFTPTGNMYIRKDDGSFVLLHENWYWDQLGCISEYPYGKELGELGLPAYNEKDIERLFAADEEFSKYQDTYGEKGFYVDWADATLHKGATKMETQFKVKCTECEAMVVNGVPVHESGCPNIDTVTVVVDYEDDAYIQDDDEEEED